MHHYVWKNYYFEDCLKHISTFQIMMLTITRLDGLLSTLFYKQNIQIHTYLGTQLNHKFSKASYLKLRILMDFDKKT